MKIKGVYADVFNFPNGIPLYTLINTALDTVLDYAKSINHILSIRVSVHHSRS